MATRNKESDYYEPIRHFLHSKWGCVVESYNRDGSTRRFIGRGLGGLLIDVYGLRGVEETGARTIEGISVEVKRSSSRTSLRNLVQANQYARMAHRCYLAQPRQFDQRTVDEASRSGIGLLEISKGNIRVRAESKKFSPDPKTFLLFLHKSLRMVRCALCSCFLYRYRPGSKGVAINGHWVRDQIAPIKPKGKFNKKMYICSKCEEIIHELTGYASLRKSIDRLEKKTKTLQRKAASKK